MVYTDTIKIKVKSQGFSDITSKVEDIVKDSEIEDGICTIFAVGATSSIIINEDDPMLLQDLKDSLEKIAPKEKIYHHSENAFSHLRSAFIGTNQTIPVKDGELILGTWQEIMVANFDTEDREREVVVTILGD
jgi:secondary thiamine-phosphate synthase enzyme